MPEDVAFLDLEIQEHAGSAAAGLVVFQQPEMELYQGLVEAAQGLQELRSLYEHLQARILEMIETLDELRASPELEIFKSSEECWGSVLGVSDLNIFHRFSLDFLDFSEVSEVTEELICRGAEETGELTREVPFGKDFPEYPCPFPTHP